MDGATVGKGIRLPKMGFGTFPNKEALLEAIPRAVKAGCRLIDTSDNYNNEEWVGRALSRIGSQERERVIVTTKFSTPRKTKCLQTTFDHSTELIGKRPDIYLLHWPYPFLWKLQWKAMERLYVEGKCKAIGVCNFEEKHLKKLMKRCSIAPMINQIELHPLFQQKATTEYCKRNGIAIMSYTPLARNNAELMENDVLRSLASKHDKTVGQIVLRWHIEHGFIPIPASKSERHIRENFDVFDFELTPKEVQAIDELDRGMRVRFDPDKRFSFTDKLRFIFVRIMPIKRKPCR